MSEELKPCPFCKESEFITLRFEKLFDMDFHYVHCRICEARGPRHIHKEKAIELWNESWKKENE